MVGNSYVPVQNHQAFRFLDAVVAEGDLHYHTAGGRLGKLLSPAKRRHAVAYVRNSLGQETISERRACRGLGQVRSTQRRQAHVPNDEPRLIREMGAGQETIRELLPGKEGDLGRPAVNNRLFVNAVLFVLKTGIPWEDLSGRYGKPNRVWKRFDRWYASGVWKRIARALGNPHHEEVPLDSTTIKVHPIASTGRR